MDLGRTSFMVIGCLGVSVAACSGDSGLFGNMASGDGGTASLATSGAGGTASKQDAAASTAQAQSAQATSAHAQSAQATSAQATSAQATSTQATTVSAAQSSSSGGATKTLACGETSCDAEAEYACCWDQWKLYGAPQGECVKGNIWNDNCDTMQTNGGGAETRIECQQPSDCDPGESCCGRKKNVWKDNKWHQVYDQVVCQAKCNANSQVYEVTLCTPNVTVCPNVYKDGSGWVPGICKQSELLPKGYHVCGVP